MIRMSGDSSRKDEFTALARAEANKHVCQGLDLEDKGEWEQALGAYELALSIDPGFPAAWCNKGGLLYDRGRSEEALECWTRGAELEPDGAVFWSNKAILLQEMERFEEAAYCWRRVMTIDPNRDRAYRELGNCLIGLRRYQEAVEAFDNELRRNPGDPDCHLARGVALKRTGRIEEAIAAYDRSLLLDPTSPVGWKNKAIAFLALKRYTDVIECCNHGLCLGPSSDRADMLSDKAVALKELGRLSEALECHNRALALHPQHALNLRNKAVVLHKLGEYEAAIECDEHALRLDPDNPGIWENKAKHIRSVGREEEAAMCLRRAELLAATHSGPTKTFGTPPRASALANFSSVRTQPKHEVHRPDQVHLKSEASGQRLVSVLPTASVLVLDASPTRIAWFRARVPQAVMVSSAEDALARLDAQVFDLCFLDHDLSAADVAFADQRSGSGQRVARYLAGREFRGHTVIHCVNESGASAMKGHLPQACVMPFGTFELECVESLGPQQRPGRSGREPTKLVATSYAATLAQPGRPNEDAFFIGRLPAAPLIAVFDGEGNAEGAARKAARQLERLYTESKGDLDWRKISTALDSHLLGAGRSTMAAASFSGTSAIVCAVGDSRVYLVRDGTGILLTEGASKQKLGSGAIQPFLKDVPIKDRDVVLCMTDGAWSGFSLHQLAQVVMKDLLKSPELPDSILRQASRSGIYDDMAVVVTVLRRN